MTMDCCADSGRRGDADVTALHGDEECSDNTNGDVMIVSGCNAVVVCLRFSGGGGGSGGG